MNTYIIAEIGQNHNGDYEIAKQLITMAGQPIYFEGEKLKGCDAVKLTVRDLEYELTNNLANKQYNSKHKYATRYGKHREELELCPCEIIKLREYAKSIGLDFILTLCSPTLVDGYAFLCDKIKVASRDLDNIPLLKALNKTRKEIILSTGMLEGSKDIEIAFEILKNVNVQVLHCVSSYPTKYSDLNFEVLNKYKFVKSIADFSIASMGFSDHTTGILAGPVAVAFGATIIEKHITLDRDMKGTDHAGSLGPEGFFRFIRDIRNTEKMLYKDYAGLCQEVEKNKEKLGRFVAYKYDRNKCEMIMEQDFIMISKAQDEVGIKWQEAEKYIGKVLMYNVKKKQLVKGGDFNE